MSGARRWWAWQQMAATPWAHIRVGRSARALCGEALDPRACYALGRRGDARCPRCLVLVEIGASEPPASWRATRP